MVTLKSKKAKLGFTVSIKTIFWKNISTFYLQVTMYQYKYMQCIFINFVFLTKEENSVKLIIIYINSILSAIILLKSFYIFYQCYGALSWRDPSFP